MTLNTTGNHENRLRNRRNASPAPDPRCSRPRHLQADPFGSGLGEATTVYRKSRSGISPLFHRTTAHHLNLNPKQALASESTLHHRSIP